MKLTFKFTPEIITKILLKIIAFLLIANLISNYLHWVRGFESAMEFVPLFDFDTEFNVPSFYSALAIFCSAGLLWFIGKTEEKEVGKHQAIYWKFLAYIFIFLGLDELISIHNQFSRLTELLFRNISQIDNEEYISQSRFWIILYAPFLLFLSVFFIRFYLKLPKKTRVSFFFAGLIFVAGAIGVELLGDRYMFSHSRPDIYYGLISTLEELLEMIGIVVFIRALIYYIITNTDINYVTFQIILRDEVSSKS